MAKNLKRYYQAWELRQQGKTFKEIGKVMGVCQSRANFLVHFIDYKIKYRKPISNELKLLIKKCRPPPTNLEKKASTSNSLSASTSAFFSASPE